MLVCETARDALRLLETKGPALPLTGWAGTSTDCAASSAGADDHACKGIASAPAGLTRWIAGTPTEAEFIAPVAMRGTSA